MATEFTSISNSSASATPFESAPPKSAEVSQGTAPSSGVATPQVQTVSTIEKLHAAVKTLNDLVKSGERSLSFSVDSSGDKVVIQVLDESTDKVIRQIPDEQALKLADHIEAMVGLLFDERA